MDSQSCDACLGWSHESCNDPPLEMLLVEKILHHLTSMKPCKYWDFYHINWSRNSSITSMWKKPAILGVSILQETSNKHASKLRSDDQKPHLGVELHRCPCPSHFNRGKKQNQLNMVRHHPTWVITPCLRRNPSKSPATFWVILFFDSSKKLFVQISSSLKDWHWEFQWIIF